MGQSKQECPHCYREPGDVHSEGCPRSRKSQRRLTRLCAPAPRWFHLAKGAAQLVSGEWFENPGIGYSKKPLAAGWPRALTRADAEAIMQAARP